MATIIGTNGADLLIGTALDDLIYANAGPGSGPGDGNDTVFAGGGNDTVFGADGNDILNGGAGDDTLFGGNGDDKLVGDGGDDTLHGGNGNDNVIGGAGDDHIFGNAGDDRLAGNGGMDTLFGGAGADRFIVASGGGNDTINDLDFAEGDTLILDGYGLGMLKTVDSVSDIQNLISLELIGASEGPSNNLVLMFANEEVLVLRDLADQVFGGGDALA